LLAARGEGWCEEEEEDLDDEDQQENPYYEDAA
jgi:hypothetical protein